LKIRITGYASPFINTLEPTLWNQQLYIAGTSWPVLRSCLRYKSATASEEVLNGRGCWAWLGLILDAFQCVYQFLGLGDSYEAGEVCIYMTVMKLVHRASVVGGLERAECKCTVVMSCQ